MASVCIISGTPRLACSLMLSSWSRQQASRLEWAGQTQEGKAPLAGQKASTNLQIACRSTISNPSANETCVSSLEAAVFGEHVALPRVDLRILSDVAVGGRDWELAAGGHEDHNLLRTESAQQWLQIAVYRPAVSERSDVHGPQWRRSSTL